MDRVGLVAFLAAPEGVVLQEYQVVQEEVVVPAYLEVQVVVVHRGVEGHQEFPVVQEVVVDLACQAGLMEDQVVPEVVEDQEGEDRVVQVAEVQVVPGEGEQEVVGKNSLALVFLRF